jgi:hypothetical protein
MPRPGSSSSWGCNTYGPEARARRRCLGVRKDGQPCGCYALWDDDRQLCFTHAGRHHTGPIPIPTRYTPCTCVAYPFSHRPGAGLCRWPDQPLYYLNRRPGVHAEFRYRGSMAMFGPLKRRWQRDFRFD